MYEDMEGLPNVFTGLVCVEADELPYKTTFGLPIRQCHRVTPTPYEHPRGAIGIVKYR